jgi:hypothetical protein
MRPINDQYYAIVLLDGMLDGTILITTIPISIIGIVFT